MSLDATGLVWLAAGTGLGLTLAMFILGGVLLVDGRKMKQRVRAANALKAAEPPPKVGARPIPTRAVVTAPPPQRKASPPPPPPLVPRPAAPAPEPGADADDPLVRDLAAAIEQSRTAEPVMAKPVETVAVPVVPEPPVVVEAKVAEAPKPVAPAEPVKVVQVETPVAEPVPAPEPIRIAKPAPPLPKVTPARKFAPALPPKNGSDAPKP